MPINLSSSNLNHQNTTKHLNCSIQDNMELLELALKHSIDWSVKSKQNNTAEHLKEADSTYTKLHSDSHVRAFVSQFKIELNHLMGLKIRHLLEHLSESSLEESSTDQESFDSDEDVPFTTAQYRNNKNMLQSNKVPRIEIGGKYCGQYSINENTDDIESYSKAVADQVSLQKEKGRDREKHAKRGAKFITRQPVDEDFDCGYGSLNRGSFKSCPDLIQQLFDLRSRLIDLVQELDESVERRLSGDQLESYRRRRDALMCKIDSLIDCYDNQSDESSPVLIGLTDSESNEDNCEPVRHPQTDHKSYNLTNKSQQVVSRNQNKSSNMPNGNEYEEQVHIIVYNNSSSDSTSFRSSKFEQDAQFSSGLDRVELLPRQSEQSDEFIPLKCRPIDFGAMMRSYETSIGATSEIKPETQQATSDQILIKSTTTKHVPSSSSTSSSSHVSSSSSSFL